MKHLKLFSTESEYLSAKSTLTTPYVCYVEDSGNIYYQQDAKHIIIMTAETNPSVLAICHAQGWCSEDKMTLEEALNVTSIGTAFASSQIGDFNEFKFFTNISNPPIDAFQYSTVTSLTYPDQVTTLFGLRNVNSLKELHFPNSLVSMNELGYNVFSVPRTCSIYLGDNLQGIGINKGRINFGKIEISKNNPYLEIHDGVLYNTYSSIPTIEAQVFNSSEITILDGVENIPECFAEDNTNVTTLNLPSSVSQINDRFCRNATTLKTINCNATTPPTLSESYLLQNVTLNAIRVPSASIDAYKAASGWSNFANIITAI